MAHKILPFEGVLTKTAPYTPANGADTDISAVPAEFQLYYSVHSLTGDAGTPIDATIVVESSTDAFVADSKVIHAEHFKGPVTSVPGIKRSVHSRKLPGNEIGTGSAKVRARLQTLDGSNPSITFENWLEYDL